MNHRRRPGTPSPLDPATCPLTCAAKNTGLNTAVQVKHGAAQASPSLTQDQRLAWLNELLTGTSESFPDRVAGVLLLLYAQPLVCVTALETDAFTEHGDELHVELGRHAATVPQPFAGLVRHYLANRPNLRTGGGSDSPWLFPSTRAGQHIHPNTMMMRLRKLGVNLLGARNRAIGELVLEVPPPLVADALGYSHQVALQTRRRRRRTLGSLRRPTTREDVS